MVLYDHIYQLDLFPCIGVQCICRRLSVLSLLYIDTLSKSTMPVNSQLVKIITYLFNELTPISFATVPFCDDLPCDLHMSLDESNFGPPESARRMQFTPHIEYLNTSQFEVRSDRISLSLSAAIDS